MKKSLEKDPFLHSKESIGDDCDDRFVQVPTEKVEQQNAARMTTKTVWMACFLLGAVTVSIIWNILSKDKDGGDVVKMDIISSLNDNEISTEDGGTANDSWTRMNGTSNKVHLVLYASKRIYARTQKLLVDSAKHDDTVQYISSYDSKAFSNIFDSFEGIESEGVLFKSFDGQKLRNGEEYAKHIVDLEKSGRCQLNKDPLWWIWKPFIIFKEFEKADDGDFIVYQDSSKYIRKGYPGKLGDFTKSIVAKGGENGIAGVYLPTNNRHLWGRNPSHSACSKVGLPDKFFSDQVKICDDQDCEDKIYKSRIVQASWIVLRKTPEARKLLMLWMRLSFDARVIGSLPYQDQDALNLAAIRTNFPAIIMPTFHGFPNYKNGNDVKHMGAFITSSNMPYKSGGWSIEFPSDLISVPP